MPNPVTSKLRLLSLDAYRGITMFLLMAEGAGLSYALSDLVAHDTFGGEIIKQFHHHPWNGLRFWDLIQPFFMFIVGVAMPFSLAARERRGGRKAKIRGHILRRCALLFLFGVGLHCVYSGKLVWELWNVLTQLSFTILITFFLLRCSWRIQMAASLLILVLAEVLYRAYDPMAPFVKDANFGSYVDLLVMGKINNGGGWVTINCLSTTAHTLWGAMCGSLLLSKKANSLKIKYLLVGGLAALVAGYALDVFNITPIVKRIATTSFVLASGGWAILMLVFFYWLIDLQGAKKWTTFFTIVGTNSIFIYLFAQTIGAQWLRGFMNIWVNGVFSPLGFQEGMINVINAMAVLAVMWYLCYFLYKKRIFFRV